jgi:hypothetical protein
MQNISLFSSNYNIDHYIGWFQNIRSTDPATKPAGTELGAEFARMDIDELILDNSGFG